MKTRGGQFSPVEHPMTHASQSVLAQAGAADCQVDPYPWLVIENALPDALYQELADSFPGVETFRRILARAGGTRVRRREYKEWLRRLDRANQRVNIPYCVAARSDCLSASWREFLSFHTSSSFAGEVQRVLGRQIARLHPGLRFADARIGRRWLDDSSDIALDALLAINTPAVSTGSVTAPHTDNPDKLLAGMLYFHEREDDAGGDLVVYRRLRPPSRRGTKWPVPDELQVVHRIRYRANTAVFIVNGAASVHGVTPRHASPYPRRFVNFVAQCPQPLF